MIDTSTRGYSVLVGGKEDLLGRVGGLMRSIRPAFFLAPVLGLCPVPSACVHHGNAAYDIKNTVSLTGAVAVLQLANLHSSVAFDAKDEKGHVNHWVVEFGVLRDMVQQGWTDTTLWPGDQIKVMIHPKSDGGHPGLLVGDITHANGKALPRKPPSGQQTYHGPIHW
jgi:Family of unknown function (DUF6152)